MKAKPQWARLTIMMCGLGIAVACEKSSTAPVLPLDPRQSASPASLPDSAAIQMIARNLAIALQHQSVRQQLLADLRDSPFPNHAVELKSYLQGPRGHAVLSAVAAAAGKREDELSGALHALATSQLELSMPRYGDRRNWPGDGKIVVAGMAELPQDFQKRALAGGISTIAGYDTRGVAATILLLQPDSVPALLVSPAQQSFGTDPEDVRSRAPRRTGATIGAPDELDAPDQPRRNASLGRLALPSFDVNPCPGGVCDGGAGGGSTLGPGFLILPSGQTYAACTSNAGPGEPINATCRQDLAAAFQPRPMFNTDEPCLARATQYTTKANNSTSTIEIFYALSYYRDCGNRSGTADSHNGDSEFIIVRVKPTTTYVPNGWYLANVTLSAHYGVFGGDYTWTGSPPAVEFDPYEYQQRPRVYISWGKHGNYRDIGSCGRGAWGADDCGRASGYVAPNLGIDPVGSDLGFRTAPRRNCMLNSNALPNGTWYQECYWSYAQISLFTGWWGSTPASTSYTKILSDFGF